MKKPAILFLAVVIGIALLAAVGYVVYTKVIKDSETSTNEAVITIDNFKFDPSVLTVKAGTKVTWKNDDSVLHDVTTANVLFDQDLEPGQSFSFTFDTAGTYDYYCDIHRSMTGKVVVE